MSVFPEKVQRQSWRLLVAEDEHMVRSLIRGLVEELGHVVVGEVGSGKDVLAATRELRPDAILMDVRMPGGDGITATREVMRECPTAVVLLTAYDDEALVHEAVEAGVSGYLTKPPMPSALRRSLAVAIGRFAAQRREGMQRVLPEIIPVCANCKDIRDDNGAWLSMEDYLHAKIGVHFTHGICEPCAEKLYPRFVGRMYRAGDS